MINNFYYLKQKMCTQSLIVGFILSLVLLIPSIYLIISGYTLHLTPCELVSIDNQRCVIEYAGKNLYLPHIHYDVTVDIKGNLSSTYIRCTNVGCSECDYQYIVGSKYNCELFLTYKTEDQVRTIQLFMGYIFLSVSIVVFVIPLLMFLVPFLFSYYRRIKYMEIS